MSDEEKRGALLFFGKAACEVCHTGPALNQMNFYALGMPEVAGVEFKGSETERLGRGGFLDDSSEEHKYKVPQLYNLKVSPFYGHGGTFRTLREVVVYYNDGIPAVDLPEGRITNRFRPLNLTSAEIDDLVLFLTESLFDPDLDRFAPAELPSGHCTPANDAQARTDLGC
jgi:cytochrome c peroxidase